MTGTYRTGRWAAIVLALLALLPLSWWGGTALVRALMSTGGTAAAASGTGGGRIVGSGFTSAGNGASSPQGGGHGVGPGRRPVPAPRHFTVTGSTTVALHPGTSVPVNVVIANPDARPLTLVPGALQITVSTGRVGCTASNFAVAHTLAAAVTVPGSSTASLSDLAVPVRAWPVVSMLDTGVDQDACAGAPLTLTYQASAAG